MNNIKRIEPGKYLHVVWCLLGIWILWQCGSVVIRSAWLPRRIQRALVQYKKSTEKNGQVQSSPSQHAQAPKNIFAPPQKPQIPKCMAVLGDEALINGKWCKIGSEANGIKIMAINPESVKILWKEKEHTLVPFDVQVQYAENVNPTFDSGGTSGGNKSAVPPGVNGSNPKPPGMGHSEGGPSGMSSEERRERYQNASPEEREKMKQQMKERSGGRGQRGRRPGR
ncbi:MAG: hypothetical protein KAH24_03695 [Holophagae bacterium]|nr:hypothetical protein [Holophagae bacterium]